MSRQREPFDGPIPEVAVGDRIECRDMCGNWNTMVALSGPRYDHANAFRGPVWLSVSVTTVEEWDKHGLKARPFCNWPAEDVRVPAVTS